MSGFSQVKIHRVVHVQMYSLLYDNNTLIKFQKNGLAILFLGETGPISARVPTLPGWVRNMWIFVVSC